MKFLSFMRNGTLSGALFLGLCAPRAGAATYTVTTTADSGTGSLRQAILDADATTEADTITFGSNARGVLTLTSGEININSNLTLNGPGVSSLKISGGGTQRLFNITGGQVSLQNLTLSQGRVVGVAALGKEGAKGGDSGGGAILNKGQLSLSSVTLSNNSAVGGIGGDGKEGFKVRISTGGQGGEARGGAILNAGTLTLLNTTFDGNQAIGGQGGKGGFRYDMVYHYGGTGGRGGDAYGGALYNSGALTTGSTISPSGSLFKSNLALGGAGGPGYYNTQEDRQSPPGDPGQGIDANIHDLPPTASDVTIHTDQYRSFTGQLLGTGDTFHYVITSGILPEGVTLDGATGRVSGASSVAGDIKVGYRVDDGYRRSQEAFIYFSIRPLNPQSFIVNTLSDVSDDQDNKNTLREAIALSNSLTVVRTITFASGVSGTIPLEQGALTITHDVTIEGPQTGRIIVDGQEKDRVLLIQNGTVNLSNLSVTRGVKSGIFNEGKLYMSNCTIYNNKSEEGDMGGGIHNYFTGTLELKNCTLSGNFASYGGGAIANELVLRVENCTLVNNSASHGGGIYNSKAAEINNTIVAQNKAQDGPDILTLAYSNVSTQGNYNLVQDSQGAALVGNSNITGQDPLLANLANNGGPTQTVKLLAGSPAIDKGNTSLTTDQRGISRPQGRASDIGAYEFLNSSPFLLYVKGPDNSLAGTSGSPQTVPTPLNGQSPVNTFVTFITKVRGVNGNGNLSNISFLLGSSASELRLTYNAQKNLVAISGPGGSSPSATPGSTSTLTVSSGALDVKATGVTRSGNDLTIFWRLKVTSSTTVKQNLRLRAQDKSGALSALLSFGTWTFTPAAKSQASSPSVASS